MVIFTLLGCKEVKIETMDFVGSWKADDGAIITLNKDGSYTAKNVNYYNYFPSKSIENKRLNFHGTWNLGSRKNGDNIIELESDNTYADNGVERTYLMNGKEFSHKLGMTLDITGQGVLGNEPPWNLYVFIGDPDEMNKYIFVKQ